MGRRKQLEQERLEQQKKKRRKQIIIGTSVLVCIIALIAVWIITARPASVSTISIAPDSNGDLRVAVDSLQDHLNYIDYGGAEELIFWKDGDGVIRTAFDTCEECYSGGNVHFTLSGDTLTCSLCGTTQSVSILGTDGWGGCKPVSITTDMRNDAGTEVVIPAAILAYAADMFSHWDASDFSVSFADYGTDGAHIHE